MAAPNGSAVIRQATPILMAGLPILFTIFAARQGRQDYQIPGREPPAGASECEAFSPRRGPSERLIGIGDRNLLLGAPGRSSRGPRRDPGGSQRDRPTPASRVPPYRAPGSGGVAGAPATGVKGKERHAGRTQIGTRRSAGGPRSPRRRQARRPTSRAVWRSGDAATTRCRESGTGRPAAGGGRPQPKVSQQLFDDRGRPDTRDEPRRRARRLGRGSLAGVHEGRRRLPRRRPALPPTDGTVIGAS